MHTHLRWFWYRDIQDERYTLYASQVSPEMGEGDTKRVLAAGLHRYPHRLAGLVDHFTHAFFTWEVA